jgi:hypothetical protein
MSTAGTLKDLIGSEREVAVDTLLALFDGLEAIDTGFMLGDWDGGPLRSGHPGEAQLVAMGWLGKSFHGDDDVDPIITRGDAGERVANPVMGKATLRLVRHRGVSTATMVYDKHPIFDHFRKIDEDLVMGVMDRKGDATPLCFWLRRR